MNRLCVCALIVGPVVERRGRCRRVCGGEGEVDTKNKFEIGREGDGVRSDEGGVGGGGTARGDVS